MDELIEKAKRLIKLSPTQPWRDYQLIKILNEIKKQTPAVVQCKDCIYWDKGHTEECDNSDSVCFHNGWCKPNWFCADGELR